MLNGRGMLLEIFLCPFVVAFRVRAGTSNTVAGSSTLSESQAIAIIKEIHESEVKLRNHVDKKFDALDKNFTQLDKDVAVFEERINGMDKRIGTYEEH